MLTEAGFAGGRSLVAGVSGGPDSLALLHQLRSLLEPEMLHVAHLDHSIRSNSAADAEFVAGLARAWGLPYHGRRVDVPALAGRQKWSLEEAARNARYAFLAGVANKIGATLVAVGHNADDQAETVLLHFLRGAGLTGLRGMRAISPLPGAQDLKLIRPLLSQSRDEIEAYCLKHGLKPIVDETNSDATYVRNRIRRQLLPQLASYNPQIKSQLLQLAEIAAAEGELVGTLLSEAWPELVMQTGPGWLALNRDRFQELPVALQRRAIRRAIKTLIPMVSDLSFATVEQALNIARRKESGIETNLPQGLTMLAGYETLLFSSAAAKIPAHLPQLLTDQPLPLPVPGKVLLANDWVITALPLERTPDGIDAERDPWRVTIDMADLYALSVRTRRTGERMQPLGMDGHSASLQDIMVNRKLAAHLRENWPLVAADDYVVWLTGHIIDQRARVSDNSRRVIQLTCERIGDDV